MTVILLDSRPFSSIELSGIEVGDCFGCLIDLAEGRVQAIKKSQEKHLPLKYRKGE